MHAVVRTQEPSEALRLRPFLAELTELCAKHGFGIAGEARLFVMVQEDYPHSYAADAESKLYRV